MSRMRLTVVYEYDITDNLTRRIATYGATEPWECAKVDEQNDPAELAELATLVSHTVEPIEED